MTEITFEGYASNGIAVLEASDNNNQLGFRQFLKYGGNLGTNGSLGFLFERKGIFTVNKGSIDSIDLEEVEMELIDYGLEELTEIDQDIIIQTGFDEYGTMQSALEEKGWDVTNTELQRIPLNTTALELNDAQKVMKLIDKIRR